MAISLGKVFEPFVEQRPICVMARGVLENLFNAEKIDALFARTAEVQYTRELLFSSVVDLMGQVVLGVQPSVHAAYQAQAAQLGISDQAIYDKLRQVELRVSAELVRDAARQAAPVIGALQAELPPLVPGYRTKILDGNHLAASDHRLEALRHTWAAPLPGQILVVLDQQPMLATEVVLCEDGHAQERSLLGQVLPLVEQDDLWIADRNFCTVDFLFGFCLALMAYNAVAVMKAALRAVHGHEKVHQDISSYYLALEISQTYDGMMVAIPSPHWSIFRRMNAQQLADALQDLAEHVNLRRYKKHPRGPKKKPTLRTAYKNGGHVSTAKILAKQI